MNKIMSLSDAVSKYVKNNSCVGFAGSGGRLSIAFAYETIKQQKKNLSFVSAGTGAPCLDLLSGAKLVKRAEISFTMVTCLNIKRAVEGKKKRGEYRLQIEDFSNLAMSLRFFAGATRIPFIPIRSLAGSDLEKIRSFMGKEKMATIRSPFKDKSRVTVLPPSNPDVAVMHAQCADEEGNVLALGPAGSDGWLLRAAKKRIITVEKIVSKEYVKSHNVYTFLPGFMTDAVCVVPYGAHPYGLVDCYDLDAPFQKEFNSKSKTQDGFEEWAKEWILDVNTRDEYLEKVGKETIERITNPKFAENRLFE